MECGGRLHEVKWGGGEPRPMAKNSFSKAGVDVLESCPLKSLVDAYSMYTVVASRH